VPEITELLQDAAPSSRPFDEDAIRRRVGQRRRRRYGAAVAALVLVAGIGVAAAVVASDPPEESVVAEEPVAADAVSAVALVGDAVWTAGDGWVQTTDGTRVDVPGPVLELATGDMIWAVGETWVQSMWPDGSTSGAPWTTDASIADVQPLEGERLAVSLTSGAVAVVDWFEADLSEQWHIEVPGTPTNLVLTSSNELWVNDGDVIHRIDFDAGTVVEEAPWSGALLAASRSGGIWTMDDTRVVDLHPEDLDAGASVAQGERYDVTATMAVETAAGLYVGGPEGLSRHDPGGGEVLDPSEPDDLSGNDSLVVYLVDDGVRLAHAEMEHLPDEPEAADVAVARFLAGTFGWPDPVVVPDEMDGYFHVTTATYGRDALVGVTDGSVSYVWTGGDSTDDGGISIGYGNDQVTHPYAEAGLTPELTVTYGERVHTQVGEIGTEAVFEFDLGFVPDVPGTVQVLYRNEDGIVLEAVITQVPAGPFAAG
jgi:hypothetical protein